jgi:hypothetical protein
MVTKKSLIKENAFLIDKMAKLSDIVADLSEKVEFLCRQSDLKVKEPDSLYDEWMNGAKEEGEK